MANLTDADKVIRNDVGKTIASKLDDIADAIVQQGGGAHTLDQLSDVDIDNQTLAGGQSIVYNSTTQKFENNTDPSIGDLSQLTTSDKSSLVGAVNEVNKKETETLTYSSGGNTASFKFSRFGNMVCVSGSGGAMPLPTSWTSLTGTLSANFRPSNSLSLALITGDNHLIFLEINTNGTVRVYSNYSGNLYPSGSGIYVTT